MDEILARLGEIEAELTELAAADELSEEDEARFSALSEEFETLNAKRQKIAQRNALVAEVRAASQDARNVIEGAPRVVVRSNTDPFDLSEIRGGFGLPTAELRSRALSAVEADRALTDERKEAATHLIERNRDAAGLFLATGSDAYRTGWMKIIANRNHALTSDEVAAMARADELRTAMGLTGANGGYAVPAQVDPTLILTSGGSTNPIRRLATVKTLSGTNEWKGLTTSGVSASYAAEGTEVGDNSPTFDQPTIKAERAQAFAFGSIEIEQDWDALADELVILFADAKDQLEAAKFISGTGSNEPEGLVAGLVAASDPDDYIVSAAGEAFQKNDAYALIENVPPRFRTVDGLSVLGNLATFHAAGGFSVQEDEKIFVRERANAEGVLGYFLGYKAYEVSTMDSVRDIDAEAEDDHDILVAGDIARAYYVVDRVGLTVEYVPHIFSTNANRPTGQRGWFAVWRTGAGVVNPNAARILRVSTSS